MNKKDQEINAETQVQSWIDRCVVGLNLCPFARIPFEQGRVRVQACFERSLIESSFFFKNELECLISADSQKIETSLLLFCPDTFEHFETFLDFVDEMVSKIGRASCRERV